MSEQDRSNSPQINIRSGLDTLRAPALQNVPSLATVSGATSAIKLTALSDKYSGTNPAFSSALKMIANTGTALRGEGVLPLQLDEVRRNVKTTGNAA